MRLFRSRFRFTTFRSLLGHSIYDPNAGVAAILLFVIAGSSSVGRGTNGIALAYENEADRPASVVVEALSKGKGVPEPTRNAMAEVRALLRDLQRDGKLAELKETRIGLEGETRLCAVFKNARTARETTQRLRAIAAEVELLNVREQSCTEH